MANPTRISGLVSIKNWLDLGIYSYGPVSSGRPGATKEKSETHGRLIGAAQMCLAQGIIPYNILYGITGAMLFDREQDPDHHLLFLRETLPNDMFNRYILGLRSGRLSTLFFKVK